MLFRSGSAAAKKTAVKNGMLGRLGEHDEHHHLQQGEGRAAGGDDVEAGGGILETDDPDVLAAACNEYVGMIQGPDSQSATAQTTKLTFFFAAWADGEEGVPSSCLNEAHEKYRAEWVGIAEALGRLEFDAEREMVQKVVMDMEQSGVFMPAPK